jgi:PIN domain nuclease of toxin-antitoxin system
VPDDFPALIDETGLEQLPITFEHGAEAGRLPLHHRDPFDRMLIAQARLEGLTLVTADARLSAYDVPVFQIDGA